MKQEIATKLEGRKDNARFVDECTRKYSTNPKRQQQQQKRNIQWCVGNLFGVNAHSDRRFYKMHFAKVNDY